jgi:hypothetical protein
VTSCPTFRTVVDRGGRDWASCCLCSTIDFLPIFIACARFRYGRNEQFEEHLIWLLCAWKYLLAPHASPVREKSVAVRYPPCPDPLPLRSLQALSRVDVSRGFLAPMHRSLLARKMLCSNTVRLKRGFAFPSGLPCQLQMATSAAHQTCGISQNMEDGAADFPIGPRNHCVSCLQQLRQCSVTSVTGSSTDLLCRFAAALPLPQSVAPQTGTVVPEMMFQQLRLQTYGCDVKPVSSWRNLIAARSPPLLGPHLKRAAHLLSNRTIHFLASHLFTFFSTVLLRTVSFEANFHHFTNIQT